MLAIRLPIAIMCRVEPHIVAALAGAGFAARNIPSDEHYLAPYCGRLGWLRFRDMISASHLTSSGWR